MLALAQNAQDIAKLAKPMLKSLNEKGIKIKVLAPEETSPETVRALSRIADVRLKNNMFGGGVIGDSSQVIILLNEGRSDSQNFEPIGIWADHIGLAGFAEDYFQYLWADASNRKKASSQPGS